MIRRLLCWLWGLGAPTVADRRPASIRVYVDGREVTRVLATERRHNGHRY